MNEWYILYGGQSMDGLGPSVYQGRTTDKQKARNHYEACRKNPYSTGKVVIFTEDLETVAHPGTNWDKL